MSLSTGKGDRLQVFGNPSANLRNGKWLLGKDVAKDNSESAVLLVTGPCEATLGNI